MTKTTRDEINIDLDGSIEDAIKELRRLKRLHPDGTISLENEYEYGESYARLKLEFRRPMEPVEIELEAWKAKRQAFDEMARAARAYGNEGDTYPRADELEKLREELGCFAEPMASLVIVDGEILNWNFYGARTRDGEWRMRPLWAIAGPPTPDEATAEARPAE